MTKLFEIKSKSEDFSRFFTYKDNAEAYLKFIQKYRFGEYELREQELDLPTNEWYRTEVIMNKDGIVLTLGINTVSKPGLYRADNNRLQWIANTQDVKEAINIVEEIRLDILKNDAWGNEDKIKKMII